MRATATGEGEERRVDVVVCSEREEAGLAAAPVALRRLSGLVALRRDLAALVAAARWLLRGGGAVAPVGRAPAATVGVRPAPALAASVEPVAPRGARRRGRAEHRAVRTAPRRRLLGAAPSLARRLPFRAAPALARRRLLAEVALELALARRGARVDRRCGTRPRPRGEAPACQIRRAPTRRHSLASLKVWGRLKARPRGRGLYVCPLQE